MADLGPLTDIVSYLQSQVSNLPPKVKPENTAYTRVTRTPVRWSDNLPGNTYALYHEETPEAQEEWMKRVYPDRELTEKLEPQEPGIEMNSRVLPQANPDMQEMSNTLRHESVHALMSPDTHQRIAEYLDAHPKLVDAAAGKMSRKQQWRATPEWLAAEDPAYAVEPNAFTGPDAADRYRTMMPEDERKKYDRLVPPPPQSPWGITVKSGQGFAPRRK